MIIGIAIVIVGAVFLLQNLGFISASSWNIIWPLLLIFIGVSMICKKKGHCECGCESKDKQ
jgi:hypothetical protein